MFFWRVRNSDPDLVFKHKWSRKNTKDHVQKSQRSARSLRNTSPKSACVSKRFTLLRVIFPPSATAYEKSVLWRLVHEYIFFSIRSIGMPVQASHYWGTVVAFPACTASNVFFFSKVGKLSVENIDTPGVLRNWSFIKDKINVNLSHLRLSKLFANLKKN